MEFITKYTSVVAFLTERNLPILKNLDELTSDYTKIFMEAYKHPKIFTSVTTFTSNNMYTTMISKKNFKKLSDDDKLKFVLLVKDIATATTGTSESDPLSSLETMFKNQNIGSIDNKQIESAKEMVTKTLGLENSPMGSIITSMVSDISSTLGQGKSFKDMIADLSKNFGDKIKENVDSGKMTKEQLESSTGDLFAKLKDITKNPNDLIKQLSGDASAGPVDKAAAKKARRDALKKKWRKDASADLD
jgi:hypothetical protein